MERYTFTKDSVVVVLWDLFLIKLPVRYVQLKWLAVLSVLALHHVKAVWQATI